MGKNNGGKKDDPSDLSIYTQFECFVTSVLQEPETSLEEGEILELEIWPPRVSVFLFWTIRHRVKGVDASRRGTGTKWEDLSAHFEALELKCALMKKQTPARRI